MLKLLNFCLKTYNLQNIAVNVIIIKRLLHLRSNHTEVSLRLTIPMILNARCTEKHVQESATRQSPQTK